MNTISIVVPFLNEESCIDAFCVYIDEYCKNKPYSVELIFVNDGSTDKTVEYLCNYNFNNISSVKVIIFSKNFGSHAAIRAGISQSSGDYCTFMGVDLQEPDDMLDTMFDTINNGYDAVYIEKKTGGVNVLSRMFSLVYAGLMRKFAVKNYGSGGVNSIMFNSTIKEFLNQNIESNSSLLLQIIDAGFNNKTIAMEYKSRTAGKSKWTLGKKIKLLIDSFVAFSYMPIRVVSIAGILMAILGFVFGIYIVINRILNPEYPVAGYTTLASLILFGFGITNISLGIIAEYLWRTYDAARRRPAFIISEIKKIK